MSLNKMDWKCFTIIFIARLCLFSTYLNVSCLLSLLYMYFTLCSSIDSIQWCLSSDVCVRRYHKQSLTLTSNRHSSNSWGWKEKNHTLWLKINSMEKNWNELQKIIQFTNFLSSTQFTYIFKSQQFNSIHSKFVN